MTAPTFVIDHDHDAGVSRSSLVRKLANVYGLSRDKTAGLVDSLAERILIATPLSQAGQRFEAAGGNLRSPVADAIEHAVDLAESTPGTRVFMYDEHHWTQVRADPASTGWAVTAWYDTEWGPAITRTLCVTLISRAEYLARHMSRTAPAELVAWEPPVATVERRLW